MGVKKIGEVLTVADVAAKYKISKSTVYALVKSNKIPKLPIPGSIVRFDSDAVDAILSQASQENPKPPDSLKIEKVRVASPKPKKGEGQWRV